MWSKVAGGVILYGLAKAYNWYTDECPLVEESSKYNSLFAIANRLEKLSGGKAYVGLRIPDADIDIVLVTKGKAVVISVKDISGMAVVFLDSSWVIVEPIKGTQERLPNAVVETKRKASILKSYLEQKGVALAEGCFSCYVVLPNPNLRTIPSSFFPPEVINFDRWQHLKQEQKRLFSGCAEGAFRGREEMLDFILSKAPMWDRLELEGNKYVLGEFLDFEGKQAREEIQALKKIERSKVSHLQIVPKTSTFGLEGSMLIVLYSRRGCQGKGGSASEKKVITVSSSIQVLFQPQNRTEVCRLMLSSLVSLSLSSPA